jgi:hypothetical protein
MLKSLSSKTHASANQVGSISPNQDQIFSIMLGIPNYS